MKSTYEGDKTDGIRTYRVRGTRITAPQQKALDNYWDLYGIEPSETPLNFAELFPAQNKYVFEIGFGMGEATWQIARDSQDTGFIAIDVHRPGIGRLLAEIVNNKLTNLRAMFGDAHLIFKAMVPDQSLDGVHLFFPDPWPKKRQHKRRIVNEEFISLVHSKLKPGGYIHIATDWVPYAEWIEEKFATTPLFTGGVVERPTWRPQTRFEGQGLRKEHQISDLRYTKN
jgi:tRNA (guanine-N7-)-methyltransferase